MAGDWIKLHRKIIESRVWSDASLLHTWTALLLNVNWKTGWFKLREIRPGQLAFSWRTLPTRLHGTMEKPPSINTMRRRMQLLESFGMVKIEHTETRDFSVVTVVNWDSYQNGVSEVDTPAGTPADTPVDTPPDTPADTDIRRLRRKEGKEGKNGSCSALAERFQAFWSEVPRKQGKRKAQAAYEQAEKRIATERRIPRDEAARWLLERVRAYAASDVGRGDPQFVKTPAPWLNGGHYDDDDAMWRRNGEPEKPKPVWQR